MTLEPVMIIVIERDGDMWTAQCSPYDIYTEGGNLDELLYLLRSQIASMTLKAKRLENIPRMQGGYP